MSDPAILDELIAELEAGAAAISEPVTSLGPVPAAHAWHTNGAMIADVARLGYIAGRVLDVTYGLGRFWSVHRPGDLTCHDLNPAKGDGVDFRSLPHADASFDTVVMDPPYKLNGTPSGTDEQYGVNVVKSWQDRHALIRDGMTECARVLRPGGHLLVKCQAQVCSGAIRWQDRTFADHGESLGLTLVDRFDLLGTGRAQPPRTRADGRPSVQQHAYGRPSTLLVFQ